MKATTKTTMAMIAVLAAGLTAGSIPSAQAANVNLNIYEYYYPDGTETAGAQWSSDPAAVINVTRDLSRTDGEVWLIDLSSSGHQATGNHTYSVFSWVEPEHPGLYNNLYFDDPQHLHMESEWPTATSPNPPFANGVSIYWGEDFNGDNVYARVVEIAVPEPSTLVLLLCGLVAGLIWRRR